MGNGTRWRLQRLCIRLLLVTVRRETRVDTATVLIFPPQSTTRQVLGVAVTGPPGGLVITIGGATVDSTDRSDTNTNRYPIPLQWPGTETLTIAWTAPGHVSATIDWEYADALV